MRRVFQAGSGAPILRTVLVVALFAVLAFEVITYLPTISGFWRPFDYNRYVEIGSRLVQDPHAYGRVALDSVYPLPFELLFFVPLALLPEWFKFVWCFGPFVSLLVLFRRQSFVWFFFTPAWQVAYDGSVDGWFMVPLAWVLENRPIYAAFGALFLLFKPQVAGFVIAYTFIRWLLKRDWKNLSYFIGGGAIISIPAFVLDPLWIWHMFASLPVRINDPLTEVHLRWTTIWFGIWHGVPGYLLVAALAALTGFFFWRAWKIKAHRSGAIHLLDLLTVFLLYVTSIVTVPPTVRNRRAALWIVGISLVAFAIYSVFWPFSGLYVFVPLAALYFIGMRETGEMAAGEKTE